ncbi:hypothetical protein L3X39_13870 [Sabulilitoribacter multivorans]|uniref:DUF4198 domain-containing protein n=1 Tax=Flaviramulus multivorans TaxID=1304750 RepID=A0ABS9IMA0_9FLAO|nr:hypothetical protein [Flaviramulus multivorans]MCF7561731.1 hypothetical protein [Flaviramulus multivorans]
MNLVKQTKILSLSILILFVFSCKTDKKEQNKIKKDIEKQQNYIEIITRSMEFICPDTISSGWNTFKYYNLSNETHFFLMDKYPEGKTIENTLTDIAPTFEKGMDLINEGKSQEGFAEFNNLPEWFFSVQFCGGSGLIGPKKTSTTTIKLDPGYYIMECYVKMPNGKFHTSMGMAKPIIVTDKDSGNIPPTADVNISISKNEGITYTGNLSKGEHIFSVNFVDQGPHEHFVGHDVNLVKLDANADIEKLEAWMNWSTPFGLKTPVPAGVTFLGGVNESPAGSVGYFKATLTSGKYAFISEVPNNKEKGMLKIFSITE